MKKEIDVSKLCRPLEEKPISRSLPGVLNQLFFFSFVLIVFVAANEHQGSMKYQENRARRKMPTKSRGYITGT